MILATVMYEHARKKVPQPCQHSSGLVFESRNSQPCGQGSQREPWFGRNAQKMPGSSLSLGPRLGPFKYNSDSIAVSLGCSVACVFACLGSSLLLHNYKQLNPKDTYFFQWPLYSMVIAVSWLCPRHREACRASVFGPN